LAKVKWLDKQKSELLALTGIDIHRCPLCQKGTLVWVSQLAASSPWDSS
jgi:hypothetical protein